jgi:hypothetical protein
LLICALATNLVPCLVPHFFLSAHLDRFFWFRGKMRELQ